MEPTQFLPDPGLDFGRFTHIMAFHIGLKAYKMSTKYLLVGMRMESVLGGPRVSEQLYDKKRGISQETFCCNDAG